MFSLLVCTNIVAHCDKTQNIITFAALAVYVCVEKRRGWEWLLEIFAHEDTLIWRNILKSNGTKSQAYRDLDLPFVSAPAAHCYVSTLFLMFSMLLRGDGVNGTPMSQREKGTRVWQSSSRSRSVQRSLSDRLQGTSTPQLRGGSP